MQCSGTVDSAVEHTLFAFFSSFLVGSDFHNYFGKSRILFLRIWILTSFKDVSVLKLLPYFVVIQEIWKKQKKIFLFLVPCRLRLSQYFLKKQNLISTFFCHTIVWQLDYLKLIHFVNSVLRSSFFEKGILLTKLFQASQSWHQLSFYEKWFAWNLILINISIFKTVINILDLLIKFLRQINWMQKKYLS